MGADEIHGGAAVQRRYDQRRNVGRQTVLDHALRRRRRQWLVEHKLAVVPDRRALRRHQYEGITEAQAGNDGTRRAGTAPRGNDDHHPGGAGGEDGCSRARSDDALAIQERAIYIEG